MWVARYIMARIGEQYGVDVELHASRSSPFTTNRLAEWLRDAHQFLDQVPPRGGGQENISRPSWPRSPNNIDEHIAVVRTGHHCASPASTKRSPSTVQLCFVRSGRLCPHAVNFIKNGYRGYLEDAPAEFGGRPVLGGRSNSQDCSPGSDNLKSRFFRLVCKRRPPGPALFLFQCSFRRVQLWRGHLCSWTRGLATWPDAQALALPTIGRRALSTRACGGFAFRRQARTTEWRQSATGEKTPVTDRRHF